MDGAPLEEAGEARICLSLSGGGYRAAAFGLGAVLALIDLGLAGQIAAISSVSGGSITNAFVGAHMLTTDAGSGGTPWGRAGRLLRLLSHQDLVSVRSYLVLMGLFIGYVGIMWALASGVFGARTPRFSLLVAIILLVVLVLGGAYRTLRSRAEGILHEHLLSPAAPLGPIRAMIGDGLLLLLYGCTLQFGKYRRLAAERFPENMWSLTLGKLRATYRPIFCSTDLGSGTHVYLSDRFVGGVNPELPDDPRADCVDQVGAVPDWPLAKAVMASAAFPGVMQPMKVSDLGFSQPKGAAPARLADGGLHDNLGFTFPKAWHEGRLSPDIAADVGPRPNVFIVVDSGFVGQEEIRRQNPLRAFKRSIDVVHKANSSARREQVKAFLAQPGVTGAIVSISDNPYRIAKDHGDLIKALDRLAGENAGITHSWWQTVAQRRNPNVRTELRSLSVESTARLVLHGYAATLAHVALLLRRPLPADLPTLREIEERCIHREP